MPGTPIQRASLPRRLHERVRLEPAQACDLDALVALRIEAMRESLERLGRFDPARARARFHSGFSPKDTRWILCNAQRVGFLVTKPQPQHLLLDHFYIQPASQGQGLGTLVLQMVFAQAELLQLPVRVGALRESASNTFYLRHGFTLVESSEFDHYYVRLAAVGN